MRIKSVRRPCYSEMLLTVCAKDAAHLLEYAEECGIRAEIIAADKSVRIADMLAKRLWIPLCAVLLTAAAIWLSGYCLKIEFPGNEREFELAELLRSGGTAVGMRKSDIDLRAVEDLIYAEFPSTAYAEAHFEGTKLIVTVQAGNPKPKLLSEEPCSVAAVKRGVILSITVGEGAAAAEPGDIVEEGGILISGAYRKKEKDFLVHARGTVLAQVDYTAQASADLEEGLVRTGKSVGVRYLTAGRLRIKLNGGSEFPLGETEITAQKKIPENMPFFIGITDAVHYECVRGIKDELRTAAEIRLREEAYYKALSEIPQDAEILDMRSVITERQGRLSAVVTVTTKEDIGREVPAGPEDIITEESGDA